MNIRETKALHGGHSRRGLPKANGPPLTQSSCTSLPALRVYVCVCFSLYFLPSEGCFLNTRETKATRVCTCALEEEGVGHPQRGRPKGNGPPLDH